MAGLTRWSRCPPPPPGRDRTGAATPVPARLLLLAIVLVAVNLRAALASLPPLVHTIQADLGLSGAGAGLLTTLPVLCMGVFAPVSQRLARSIGREATVGVALVLLLLGLVMRLAGSVLPLLLLSTLLAGIGIALCGTVLPGIVKEFFADRPGIVTGVYLLAMMVGATAASALAVPLSHALGSWERSLAAWSVLAVVGLLAWLPVVRAVNDHDDEDPSPETASALPWRSPTAWLLASYLAMQSFGFYSQLAWISPSYEDRGWSARDAGLLLAVWSIVQLVSGLGVPVLADRLTDRRPLVAAAVICGLVGLIGVLVAPGSAPVVWVDADGPGPGRRLCPGPGQARRLRTIARGVGPVVGAGLPGLLLDRIVGPARVRRPARCDRRFHGALCAARGGAARAARVGATAAARSADRPGRCPNLMGE